MSAILMHCRVAVMASVMAMAAARTDAAFALDPDAALAQCRESVGRPIVHDCVRAKVERSGGPGQQYVEGCRSNAKPAVQACVGRLLGASIARKGTAAAPASGGAIAEPSKRDIDAARTEGIAFVAPPRSVADITAILDQQKPDPAEIAKLTAKAEASPPQNVKSNALAEFFYDRAQARAAIGRGTDALADAQQAITHGQGGDYKNVGSRYEQFAMRRYGELGDLRRAAELNAKQQATFGQQNRGRLFGLNLFMLSYALQAGDVDRADQYATRNRTLLTEAKSWGVYALYGSSYEASVEAGNARVAEARGRYADAEAGYDKASHLYTDALRLLPQWPSAPPASEFERAADLYLAFEGRVKVKQGRVGEGEADVRRALLSRLAKNGKYHVDTALVLGQLVFVITEQGRYADAEKLQSEVIDIYKGLGYAADNVSLVGGYATLATIFGLERRYDEAGALYDRIDGWTSHWDPALRENVSGGLSRVSVMLSQGSIANAVEIAQRVVDRERAKTGEASQSTAVARGFYAAALARNGRNDEALAVFRATVPRLVAASGGDADDSGATAAARLGRIRFVVEAYFSLVSRNPALAPEGIADETFADADSLLGQSVQRALQESSIRSAGNNPELAALVRRAQDTDKQIGAVVGSLNNLLAVPSGDRDDAVLRQTQAEFAKLQAQLAQANRDIVRKFPDYANLTKPNLPAPQTVQAKLADDEALLSFYFGRFDSFLWVVRRGVPTRFIRLSLTLGDLNAEVAKLREALDPNAAMISDVPPFDVARAHALYQKLLQPAEETWKPARKLIVVTNGGLGLLPLSLLPTAPSIVDPNDDPLFVSYRQVPWLARSHAVTLVPSASAFVTLRTLPPGRPTRKSLIGFGDPLFNEEQAEAAAELDTASAGAASADASVATRGLPLKRRSSPRLDAATSAQLAQLPRLPDTADELRSIALALHADPLEVLNLGKNANERNVKSIDLAGFRIVAFATHGLVPGELDGLTQPALALSAPSVAGIGGDGLLTMEEILTLKLDADWVLLSACNTGAGSGAGAEAASGLGRAFFYAGTRALLVTNWSVHSQSARQLITDLFRRQADDPTLSRGEALRQAMMALVDGPGYLGADGKTEFAYAHPLFWAPYSIIGDGGRP